VKNEVRLKAGGGVEGVRCPLCREDLGTEEETYERCSACGTAYHHACHAELGGCSTLGCEGASLRPPSREPAPTDAEVVSSGAPPRFEREERIERNLKLIFGLGLGLGAVFLLNRAGARTQDALLWGGALGAFVLFVLFGPKPAKRP
tara:strand:- start:1145 stop:1585 length:441 start_codon:yes stop_codon:yes gene_type:complete